MIVTTGCSNLVVLCSFLFPIFNTPNPRKSLFHIIVCNCLCINLSNFALLCISRVSHTWSLVVCIIFLSKLEVNAWFKVNLSEMEECWNTFDLGVSCHVGLCSCVKFKEVLTQIPGVVPGHTFTRLSRCAVKIYKLAWILQPTQLFSRLACLLSQGI